VKIALAQLNTRVGAIDRNTDSLIATATHARDALGADLVLFPELTLSGYPPEDLLLHSGLRQRVGDAAARVLREVRGITCCFGLPEYVGDAIYNSAVVARDGEPPIANGSCRTTRCSMRSAISTRARNRPCSTAPVSVAA
jgi:NAD+ synthase (glutamine-hydrolysing)